MTTKTNVADAVVVVVADAVVVVVDVAVGATGHHSFASRWKPWLIGLDRVQIWLCLLLFSNWSVR